MSRLRTVLLIAAVAGLALIATQAASAGGGKLSGTVGPGFSISLKDSAGKSVTKLKAGSYTISISDKASIHDFHLSGPGVNKSTSVGGMGNKTWKVTLKPGSYHYQCDPHASIMHGNFKVS